MTDDVTPRLRHLEAVLEAERLTAASPAVWEQAVEQQVLEGLMRHYGLTEAQAQTDMASDLGKYPGASRVELLEQQLLLVRLFADGPAV